MRRAVHASLVTALCLALAASPAPAGADDAPSRKQAAATVALLRARTRAEERLEEATSAADHVLDQLAAAGCGDDFGNQIVIQHDNGYYTQYAHLSRLDVEPGDRVDTGDRIRLSGNSGNSIGPHLHFEVRVAPLLGSGVDPVPWMASTGCPCATHDGASSAAWRSA